MDSKYEIWNKFVKEKLGTLINAFVKNCLHEDNLVIEEKEAEIAKLSQIIV